MTNRRVVDRYWDSLGRENAIHEVERTGFVHPASDHNTHLVNHIDPSVVIDCPDITIGVGVTIERGTRIKADRLVIGDFCFVGDNVTLRAPEVRIGDYTRLNALSYGGGRKPLILGRNLYLGRGVYLDSNGGLTLEDNVAAGAGSQVWTHIQHGDQVQGLNPRWHQERTLTIRKDAWLVGRVVVSNAQDIGARALVLNESNVLCDIPADTTWAGNPAKDVTDKVGRQFEEWNSDERQEKLVKEINRFIECHPQYAGQLKIWGADDTGRLTAWFGRDEDGVTAFGANSRSYTKKRTAAEVAFLRFTSGKFTPVGEA